MQSFLVRSSLAAAATIIVAAGYGFMPQVNAQQTAAPAQAELAAMGAWDDATTYAKDDIVMSRGSAWISLKAGNKNKIPGQTGSQNTAGWWQLFARGFNPTGMWSNMTKYQPDDLATQNGQTYRAKVTHTNKSTANATYWELLAAKGATGATGATGPAGPNTGLSGGSQGEPAISFNNDATTGIFSPTAGKIAMVESGSLFLHNQGNGNTALGLGALANNTLDDPFNGTINTAVGAGALGSNTDGYYNTAVGSSAQRDNTNGNGNVAIGVEALKQNVNGSNNVAVGNGAGSAAKTTPQNSIWINNLGAETDSNTIKIGTIGAMDTQTSTFIAGIKNASVNGVQVYIDTTTGQLGGPGASSRRYMEDIRTMDDVTAVLNSLRPVTFRYIKPASDGSKPLHYGLIAEEVAEVMPYLAVFNADGTLRTVHYDRLPTFLLAGYQAQQKTIAWQAEEITALKERLLAIEAALPRITKAAARQ